MSSNGFSPFDRPRGCCCPLGSSPRPIPGPTGPTGSTGPTGPTGPEGSGLIILDYYNTLEELYAAHPVGNVGDAYVVGDQLYIWSQTSNAWEDAGDFVGPTGATEPFVYAKPVT